MSAQTPAPGAGGRDGDPVVAFDALGAEGGADVVVEGDRPRRRRRDRRPRLRAARRADGARRARRGRGRRRGSVIAERRRAGRRRALDARRPRSSAPPRDVAAGAPTRSSAAARPGPRWPPRLFEMQARPRRPPPGARGARPGARASTPMLMLDVGANAEVRAEHLVQFAFMGAAFAQAVLGVERPRVGLLSNGEEATKGTHERRRGARGARRRARRDRRSSATSRAATCTTGAADVVVTDGFTGNVVLKTMEGDRAGGRRRGPRRRTLERPRRGRRRCCCARRCAGCATSSTRRDRRRDPARAAGRRRRAARALHAPRASPRRSCSPRAASTGDVVGPHRGAARGAGRRRRAARSRPTGTRQSRYPRLACRRHDPRRGLQRIREHLADELDLEPAAIGDGDRASRRTSRPTRSTSTRSCRSSRTPTGSR